MAKLKELQAVARRCTVYRSIIDYIRIHLTHSESLVVKPDIDIGSVKIPIGDYYKVDTRVNIS